MAKIFTMEAEVEVKFTPAGCGDYEIEYPMLEIRFSYIAGDPGCHTQRNGDPGWPPEPAEIELIAAKLIDGKGLNPNKDQIDDWATQFLESDAGYQAARERAEERE